MLDTKQLDASQSSQGRPDLINQSNSRAGALDSSGNMETKQTSNEIKNRKKKIRMIVIGVFAVIALVLVIVLPLTLIDDKKPKPDPYESYYAPYKAEQQSSKNSMKYKLSGKFDQQTFKNKMSDLRDTQSGGSENFYLDPNRLPQAGVNNKFEESLTAEFSVDPRSLAIVMNIGRGQSIPEWVVPKATQRLDVEKANIRPQLEVSMDPSFWFQIKDSQTNKRKLLSSQGGSLVFMDKFIMFEFHVPTFAQRVYGLGERIQEFQLDPGMYKMWSQKNEEPYADRTGNMQGGPGTHPFILIQTEILSEFIGVYFRNSHAQSPIVRASANNVSTICYITTGGDLEVYFFGPGSAMDVIKQYQLAISSDGWQIANLPPFWSLGLHIAISAKQKPDIVERDLENIRKLGIQVESLWLSDFQQDDNAFTVRNDLDILALAAQLHTNNQKLVIELPSEIKVNASNDFYKAGIRFDDFVKSTHNADKHSGNLVFKSQNNVSSVLIDYMRPYTWNTAVNQFYDKTTFDGVWLKNNNIKSNCQGECPLLADPILFEEYTAELSEIKLERSLFTTEILKAVPLLYTAHQNQDKESTYYLPFIPGKDIISLDQNGISLNATSVDSAGRKVQHTQMHNIYGHRQAQITFQGLTEFASKYSDRRAFVLSDSTFSSSGQYASHFVSIPPFNNGRHWQQHDRIMSQVLNMNMFGISHAGINLHSQSEATTEFDQMFMIQLATYLPLLATDSDIRAYSYFFEFSEIFARRLNLLRLQYTCMFEVTRYGGACLTPLFYQFPDFQPHLTYQFNERTLMMAGSILFSRPGKPSFDTDRNETYFPGGYWVNIFNFDQIIDANKPDGLILTYENISRQHNQLDSYIYQGKIIPMQNSIGYDVNTTTDLIARAPISLLIHTNLKRGPAQGSLFLDGGESISELANKQFEYYDIKYENDQIQFNLKEGTLGSLADTNSNQYIENITLANMYFPTEKRDDVCCAMKRDMTFTPLNIESNKTLIEITGLEGGQNMKISDIQAIQFGIKNVSKEKYNACEQNSFKYSVEFSSGEEKKIDLSGPMTQFKLKNKLGFVDNEEHGLGVTMHVHWGDILQVKYNYEGRTGHNLIYQADGIINKEFLQSNGQKSLEEMVSINNDEYSFIVKQSDGTAAYSTIGQPLHIQPTLALQGGTWKLQTPNSLFGLGQRKTDQYYLKDGQYTIWNRDTDEVEDGKAPGKNGNSGFPLLIGKINKNQYMGVFNLNTAAQDYYIKYDSNTSEARVTFASAGGALNQFFIFDTSPDKILIKLQKFMLGTPAAPPLWAFGFGHVAHLENITSLVDRYHEAELPLDAIYTQSSFLDANKDFTFNQLNQRSIKYNVDYLHTKGVKFLPTINAGLIVDDNYPVVQEALKQGILINIKQGVPAQGTHDLQAVYYPDYSNASIQLFIRQQLSNYYKLANFDGLILDRNEIHSSKSPSVPTKRSDYIKEYRSQFIDYLAGGRSLEENSIRLDSAYSTLYAEIDMHNLYSNYMARAVLQNINQAREKGESLVLTRSHFAGLDKNAYPWAKSMGSNVKALNYSLNYMFQMSLQGRPFSGADLTGEEVDSHDISKFNIKSIVLGCLQPLTRWNFDGPQPYRYKNTSREYVPDITYYSIIQNAMITKYRLINYYSSSLKDIELRGGSFIKPLFFEFDRPMFATNMENNYMLGNALKVSTLINAIDAPTFIGHFPAGTWCNVLNYTQKCQTFVNDIEVPLRGRLYDVYLHLRQGYIISLGLPKTYLNLRSYLIERQELHILMEPNEGKTAYISNGQLAIYPQDDNVTYLVNVGASSKIAEGRRKMIISFSGNNYPEKQLNVNQMSSMRIFNARGIQMIQTDWKVTAVYHATGKDKQLAAEYIEGIDQLYITAMEPWTLIGLKEIRIE